MDNNIHIGGVKKEATYQSFADGMMKRLDGYLNGNDINNININKNKNK